MDRRYAATPVRRTGVGSPTSRPAASHALLALQRAAGNRAVTSLLRSKTPVGGTPVVQRASRDDLLTALRAAIRAESWQEVATRLNGFNEPDIVRLSAGLSVGEAANTRAAVATHLAGWPQEQKIIAALDKGRAEVARIGKIYQAYEESVRDANWAGVVRQLHAMSKPDVDARLGRLAPDALRSVCAVAPEVSGRVAPWALAVAKSRGVEIPDGLGQLTVGDRDLGATRDYRVGGEVHVDVAAPIAQGEGASIGPKKIATGLVTLAGVIPLAELSKMNVALKPSPAGGSAPAGNPPASGVFRTGTAPPSPSPVVPGPVVGQAARRIVPLAIRVPVVGVAFVVGVVGPFVAGWAVAHAAEVEKALGEFGGTSAPGGAPLSGGTLPLPTSAPAPKKDRDDDECQKCPAGTAAIYGPLDYLGRATGVRAMLKGRTFTGQKAGEDPAGFVSGVSGKEGEQHRAHLLARTLGGSGERDNLVPFGGLQNIKMYTDIEEHVEEYVTLHPTHCVTYVSTPSYEGSLLSASSIHVLAQDQCTGEIIINRAAYNRTVH